ncbi:hypothetical protein NG895_01690 [Aeoliella sp. ICT_H6.2]|uniref:Leucine Rich repeats (2 copies) n=1 Tax=Aeoliella straminimaris TaxID=2954799 RepID=A0A9X2F6P7_9BACT|nr:hypothetical protein [Aeoliella straminimaris]MCO6042608.1 hypothetical protein [Aeoliella straminimaris]
MFRFRLRTFLVAITLFCLLLGWRISAVESVERPIRELGRLGWKIEYKAQIFYPLSGDPILTDGPRRTYWKKLLLGHRQYDLPNFVWLGTESEIDSSHELRPVLQQTVPWINDLPTIESVDLSRTPAASDCIEPLSHWRHLRTLSLNSTNLDDTSVDQLAKLTRLNYISLWNTDLTAEGAAELERRLPNIQIEHDFNDD